MEGVSTLIKPKIVVFAGPNGSGKSTVTDCCNIAGMYINADEIQKYKACTVMEAAIFAENLRESALQNKQDFTFETVLSTTRNLNLLQRAKDSGYFIRGYYVLTKDVNINITRVRARVILGGHGVPEEKIRSRYVRALQLLPQFVNLCDICTVYDNSDSIPVRIFKKTKTEFIYNETRFWSQQEIAKLVGL